MKRRAIPFLVAAALVGVAAGWWWQVGRPQAQAVEVADILSGRDSARLAFGTGPAGRAERLWAALRGRTPIGDVEERQTWAVTELYLLANDHPIALERAAQLEPEIETRKELINAIRKSDAFRRLPLEDRLDEALEHYRYDYDVTGPEKDALLEGREMALPRLHALLRQGVCPALSGLALLNDRPAPGEVADALVVGSNMVGADQCQTALVEKP